MIQKSQTALPWGRITGVLIVAVGLLWVTVRNLKIQNADAPVNHAENKKSKGYDCLEDTPLPEAESRPLVDATDEIGLTFSHAVGPLGTYYVPESVGSGAAWSDFDNDGRLDLLMINGERSPKAKGDFPLGTETGWVLYRGLADGTLQDVSAQAGLDGLGFGMGCAVGDVDNDGDSDVYVTCVKQDRLLLNEGNLQFRDVAVAAGIVETEWGTGVSFSTMIETDFWTLSSQIIPMMMSTIIRRVAGSSKESSATVGRINSRRRSIVFIITMACRLLLTWEATTAFHRRHRFGRDVRSHELRIYGCHR